MDMQQTLTTPPVRPAVAVPAAARATSPGVSRSSFRERLQARRARNAPMARQILAMPATRGVGGALPR